MASDELTFDRLRLREWCDTDAKEFPMSMSQLLAQSGAGGGGGEALPFTSLDTLHEACAAIPQSRDMTVKVEQSFLAIKDSLKVAIDPLTQPLSW